MHLNNGQKPQDFSAILSRVGSQKENQRNLIGGHLTNNSATVKYYHSSRFLFYYFLNIENYPEALPLAKQMAEDCFADAKTYMEVDHPESEFPFACTFFEYDHDTFEKKTIATWQFLMKTVLDDWLAKGAPNKWYCKTKEHLKDFLIQEAPFHLTDGAWLRGSIPSGTITPTDAALVKVYFDELGNGTVNMNHCNVYDEVLKSLGVYLPHVTSRAFVEQEMFLDGPFISPTFPLAVSLFPRTFKPEIIGMTLWLELSSASLHAPQAKILERYSLSPLFSRLHTAIDNPVEGHSHMAKEAVRWYLDDIQSREGVNVMKEHWKRIWTGYVAYAITGGYEIELNQSWAKKYGN